MKRIDVKNCKLFVFSAALLAGLQTGVANAQTFSSVWNTSEGRMNIQNSGGNISATYDQDNGRIYGTLNGRILSGYWAEDSTAKRCQTMRLGSYYWGNLRFEFNGSQFSGRFAYCDDAANSTWTGNLISGNPIDGARQTIIIDDNINVPISTGGSSVWNTTEGRMTFTINNNQLSGTYSTDNGRVSGNVNGNVFDGYWGEDSSGKRCGSERMGTYYWGRLHWVFDGNRFNGQWSYCDDALGGTWNGTYESGAQVQSNSQNNSPPQNIGRPAQIASLPSGTSVWDTSEGRLTAQINGTNISGRYSTDNGRISGQFNGNVMDGYWGEDSSGKRCSSERMGTYYWGRLHWVFDGSRFTGQWSYCDDALGGSWTGTRVN